MLDIDQFWIANVLYLGFVLSAVLGSLAKIAGYADAVMGLRTKEVTIKSDEGIRPGTTYEGIMGIKPAMPGGVICGKSRKVVPRFSAL